MLKKLVAVLLVVVPLGAFAAEEGAADDRSPALGKGVKGLSFALPAGGAPTVGATYFLEKDTAVRADFGLNLAIQPDFEPAFSLELGYRKYSKSVGMLYPFMQPGIFIKKDPGDDFAKTLTLALTGAIGAEYFFTERFSVGGSTGLALMFSNEFDNIALTTGTSQLFASFYW